MTKEQTLTALPERVRAALEELLALLRRTAGDQLVAVLAHGSVVRGEYREASSDVDLVIVLEADPVDLVERLGPGLLVARDRARIEVMILRRDELAASADVFPILYEDLSRTAVALEGKNPFTELVIHDQHKRLRIEQELREARIRLRVAIADAAAGLLRKPGIVERKLKQLRSPLAALAALSAKPISNPTLAQVLTESGAMLGVDVKPLAAVREQPDQALASLVRLLDAAINHANDLEVHSRAGASP
ncbi:MAG: nucleotidyltransferase domain-containing protein [Polyangiaceae bacterium]